MNRALLLRLVRREEFQFLLVGGFNTVLGLAVFSVLYTLWPDVLHYMGSLVIAYAVGISVGFYLHRRFVFRVHGSGSWLADLGRFVLVQGAGLGLNAILLPALVEVAGLPVIPAQVLALGLVVIASYVGHKWFTFRRGEASDLSA